MKHNEELIKEFERNRKLSLQECQDYINSHPLNEAIEDEQIMEVDDIHEYMKSLGYSTIEEIKEKYNI